jgi:hypothetical protein
MVQTDKFYQSGGVLNLNPREFERWCQTLNLPAATVEAIAKIRSAPPSRRVQGRVLDDNDIGGWNDSLVGSQISLRERYANEKRGIDR